MSQLEVKSVTKIHDKVKIVLVDNRKINIPIISSVLVRQSGQSIVCRPENIKPGNLFLAHGV
jgi:hypothetical protein